MTMSNRRDTSCLFGGRGCLLARERQQGEVSAAAWAPTIHTMDAGDDGTAEADRRAHRKVKNRLRGGLKNRQRRERLLERLGEAAGSKGTSISITASSPPASASVPSSSTNPSTILAISTPTTPGSIVWECKVDKRRERSLQRLGEAAGLSGTCITTAAYRAGPSESCVPTESSRAACQGRASTKSRAPRVGRYHLHTEFA